MTIGKKIVAGFVVPLVMLAAIAALAYWSTALVINNDWWVAHTHEVLDNLDLLLSAIKDAETGQRGYLLTDKPSYLEPYNTALTGWEKPFQDLETLTHDNPNQQARLTELRPLVESKFAELKKTIELRDKKAKAEGGGDAALELVKTDAGKQDMDRIRAIMNDMRDEEIKLLRDRDAESRWSVLFTWFAMGAGTFVAFVIVFVVAYFVVRSVTQPVRSAIQLPDGFQQRNPGNGDAAGDRGAGAGGGGGANCGHRGRGDANGRAVRPAGAGVGEAVQRTLEIGKAGRKAVEDSIAALGKVQEQVETTARKHPGPGRAGPGHRRDHRHRQRHRRADQPAGPQRRHRGQPRRRARQGLRRRGRRGQGPGRPVQEGDGAGAADPRRDPEGAPTPRCCPPRR